MLSRADAGLSSERTRRRRSLRLAWPRLASLALLALGSRVARADAPGLTIETGSPDALCPDLATTRAAVERRLGQLVVPDGSAFTARYTIGHAPSGTPRDFVRLELQGPDGAVQLTRDLPLDGESCSTMADVIALVLDRHFRALLGREGPAEPLPAPLPAPPPEPPQSPQSSPATDRPSASLQPAPAAVLDAGSGEDPARAAGSAGRSFSVELGLREARHAALGGRALFEVSGQALVGAALHVDLAEQREAIGPGTVSSRELVARAFAAWAPRLGPLQAYLGPGVRLSVAHGESEGLAATESGLRLRPCYGVDGGLAWRSAGGWMLSAFAAVDVMVPRLGGWFSVAGADVLEPSGARLWLGAGVGYAP